MRPVVFTCCYLLICSSVLAAVMGPHDLDTRIRMLIEDVAIPSAQPGKYEMHHGKHTQIYRELERLGMPAVPYIIKYMDDRRSLPYRYIALSNAGAKNSFEAIRQYTPEKVVDALAAILNQITGERFGTIYNGATENERDRSVAGWRAWCAAKWPDKKDICAGPSQP